MYQVDELYHHGIKGMKWGIRKRISDAGSTHKARKDAKEFARAKMFYGESAGTRRKLIKAKVNQRSTNDKVYKKEFDKSLAKQDMGKHADAAKRERKTRNVSNSVKKTSRGIVNIVAGNPQRAGASLIAAYGILRVTGMDKVIMQKGSQKVRDIANAIDWAQRNNWSDHMRAGR